MEVVIERVVPGGDGLGRVDGAVALVAGALPGERVEARIESASPRLLRATVHRVIAGGPARRPDSDICPRALDRTCGGCDWPAATLHSHAALKTSLVLDALRRIAGLREGEVPTPRVHVSPRHYRLRNRLHFDGVEGLGRLGFFAPRSHDIADLGSCELISEPLRARLPELRRALVHAKAPAGELVTIEDRDGLRLVAEFRCERNFDAEALMERLVGPSGSADSILQGLRVSGAEAGSPLSRGALDVTFRVGSGTFRVSVSSFFQGNRFLLDAFFDEVRAAAEIVAKALPTSPEEENPTALDLYAGTGFLSWPLLDAGFKTTAVEPEPSSFRDLTANISDWRLATAMLPSMRIAGTTAEIFLSKQRDPERERFDFVVVDPPRAGLSPRVRRELTRLLPPWILLVSCDPATLARDVRGLRGDPLARPRYSIERAVLLDLFPGTHHVETLLLLKREPVPHA